MLQWSQSYLSLPSPRQADVLSDKICFNDDSDDDDNDNDDDNGDDHDDDDHNGDDNDGEVDKPT